VGPPIHLCRSINAGGDTCVSRHIKFVIGALAILVVGILSLMISGCEPVSTTVYVIRPAHPMNEVYSRYDPWTMRIYYNKYTPRSLIREYPRNSLRWTRRSLIPDPRVRNRDDDRCRNDNKRKAKGDSD